MCSIHPGGGWGGGGVFFVKKYVLLLKSLKKALWAPGACGPKFVEIFLINAPILLPIAPWTPCSQAPVPPLKEEHECQQSPAGAPRVGSS